MERQKSIDHEAKFYIVDSFSNNPKPLATNIPFSTVPQQRHCLPTRFLSTAGYSSFGAKWDFCYQS